jgi:energy-coupling factor transporter transmembrane protein EcfT
MAMTKNLETADTAVKLILAIAIMIFYFTRLITGPFATALLILAIVALLIFLAKMAYAMIFRD